METTTNRDYSRTLKADPSKSGANDPLTRANNRTPGLQKTRDLLPLAARPRALRSRAPANSCDYPHRSLPQAARFPPSWARIVRFEPTDRSPRADGSFAPSQRVPHPRLV
eukprot:gene9370-biopygen3410